MEGLEVYGEGCVHILGAVTWCLLLCLNVNITQWCLWDVCKYTYVDDALVVRVYGMQGAGVRLYRVPRSLAVLGMRCGRWERRGAIKVSCLRADLEKQKAGLRVGSGWGRLLDFFP